MKEYIVKYYLSEFHGAVIGLSAGVVFLVAAILLWKFGVAHGLSRGIAYALIGGGLFFTVACVGVSINNKQTAQKVEQSVIVSDTDTQASEIERMEKVMASSYTGALIMFSLFIIVGLVFVLAFQGNLLMKGVGLGLLIIGTYGHFTEAFSMKRNRGYLEEIKSLKFENENINNMKMENKELFNTATVGNIEVRNRVIRAAIGDRAHGNVTEEVIENYRKLAAGGVGAIVTGFVTVEERESFIPTLAFYDDKYIEQHKPLTDAVHAEGGKIILQIASVGSFVTGGDYEGVPIYAPSAVEHMYSKIVPKEMTIEEIKQVQKKFADAALRGKKAGYDGVEIHGAHNFLLSLFTSPHYNRRTDAYGGNAENRARMLLETVKIVKDAVGNDYPIWVKINSDDHFDNGITLEDFLYQCKELEKLEVAAIEVSGNWSSVASKTEPLYLDAATKAAESVATDVIAAGGFREAAQMQEILRTTGIDAFGIARPFMKNPNLNEVLKLIN
jgi:2,4-dienoyl-CoA reductase-like NADH-dependent reductase (Old Yellow Enzyme family)